eukprot:2603560-Pleurochrysis_carterae.AAC.2
MAKYQPSSLPAVSECALVVSLRDSSRGLLVHVLRRRARFFDWSAPAPAAELLLASRRAPVRPPLLCCALPMPAATIP